MGKRDEGKLKGGGAGGRGTNEEEGEGGGLPETRTCSEEVYLS